MLRGVDVRQVQERLLALGYDPEGIDGIYGPKAAGAVSAFQAAVGILADGVVGPVTRSKLAL